MIKLKPDGEGEISGKLVISAGEGNDKQVVTIELNGYSGDPAITTEELPEAKKGVPYSFRIETNNKHTWNEVTYYPAEGRLPEGLELDADSGLITGTPEEAGEFDIRIAASFSRSEFNDSFRDFILTVTDDGSGDEGDDGKKETSVSHAGSNKGSAVSGAGIYYADGTISGTWQQDSIGWKYQLANGSYPASDWYQCIWNGKLLWYHFNADGYLDSGWFTDTDGNTYYLHPEHDGDFGYMYTGWNTIDGRAYFFSVNASDGLPSGALFRGRVTPDGYSVGADGSRDDLS